VGVTLAESEQAVARWSTPETCIQWIIENRDGILQGLQEPTSITAVANTPQQTGGVSQAYPQEVRMLPDFAAISAIHGEASAMGLTLNQVLQGYYRGHKTAERCINWVLEYERASNEPFDISSRLGGPPRRSGASSVTGPPGPVSTVLGPARLTTDVASTAVPGQGDREGRLLVELVNSGMERGEAEQR
jgi:hypothetical protein